MLVAQGAVPLAERAICPLSCGPLKASQSMNIPAEEVAPRLVEGSRFARGPGTARPRCCSRVGCLVAFLWSLVGCCIYAATASATWGSGSGVLSAGEPHASHPPLQSRMGLCSTGA